MRPALPPSTVSPPSPSSSPSRSQPSSEREPEAWGLAALIALSSSRAPARFVVDGEFVPFDQQDRLRWDEALIREGEAYLRRAGSQGQPLGRFQLEAAERAFSNSRSQ